MPHFGHFTDWIMRNSLWALEGSVAIIHMMKTFHKLTIVVYRYPANFGNKKGLLTRPDQAKITIQSDTGPDIRSAPSVPLDITG